MKKIIAFFVVLILLFSTMVLVSFAQTQLKFGDTTKDGSINIKDATYIQRYAALLVELDDEALVLSDVDANGSVNVRDATMIQKLLAQLIEDFPANLNPYEPTENGTDITTETTQASVATENSDVPEETKPQETKPQETKPQETEPKETEAPTKPSVDKDGYYNQVVRP